MKRRFAVLAVLAGLLSPVALSTGVAGATARNTCKTDTYFESIICFQIVGPNNTDLVDWFSGSIHNTGPYTQEVDVEVTGPSGRWGPLLSIVAPYEFDPWIIYNNPEGGGVLPGTYCAVYFNAYHSDGICQTVHP